MMLLNWVADRDTDGSGTALEPDHRWQAELWRRLRRRIGVESGAERMAAACARLVAEPRAVDLPERFSIFGATRLTTEQLQVIDALAAHRDIHLWLPHPSHRLWRRIADAATTSQRKPLDGLPERGSTGALTRRDDTTADLALHPLLRSLARDVRELQLRMQAYLSPAVDGHDAVEPAAESLLQTLQRDIHNDDAPVRSTCARRRRHVRAGARLSRPPAPGGGPA